MAETLSARRVGEMAERAALSLSVASESAFEAFYTYLAIDEPAVHLLPLHFSPRESRGQVDENVLYELGVAAKFEYARNRWLDEVADRPGSLPGLASVHRVDDALLASIHARYDGVLAGAAAETFFRELAGLYARHGSSLALDSVWDRNQAFYMTLEEYAAHARMRHGPVRAAVDAVLLAVGAGGELTARARSSWHSCALGIQLYDDALDIEEDFRDHNCSWAVGRTLEYFDGGPGGQDAPDPDAFYEVALTKGVLSETLDHAESCFAEAARLAGTDFPGWAEYQEACVGQSRRLREDYERLTAGA